MRPKTPPETWTALAHFEQGSQTGLVVALAATLEDLDGVDESCVVYDYIDPEAVIGAFGEPGHDRGIHEIRFDCEDHEIQITEDGSISARPQPAASSQQS